MSTINLSIQMPQNEDMEYSDDVYWARWEMRQDVISNEDLDKVPSHTWGNVWREELGYSEDDEYEDDEDDSNYEDDE